MLNVKNKREAEQQKQLNEEQVAEEKFRHIKPNTIEIVHYAFNYVGVLAGNYLNFIKKCVFDK